MVAGSAVQKSANLDEHQQLLMAASDMLIEIYTESTILRTQRNWQRIKEKTKYRSK
jgi:predicted house-cleaning NTP pyrophosphatase (Maf/HAM1 superfamily)